MSFNLNGVEEGAWFDFFESTIDMKTGEVTYHDPIDGAAEFCIRLPGPFWEERQRAKKKENKMELNPKTRGMEYVEFIRGLTPEEEYLERQDVIDYSITGWRNVLDSNGNEIECNRENKLKLRKIPVFDRFLSRVWEILQNVGVEEKKALEKN